VPPRRPLSAFFIFKQECYDQVKRESPTLRITDLTRLISERWRELDAQTRAYYDGKSAEAKALYEQQIILFEATYGKIQKKTRRRVLGGSSLFQVNHPNPGENSDDD